jgi:UDP-glucose 4-epimerase
MKQKVLVTGGTGYIGSHTVVELIGKGCEVVILDNLCNSEKSVVDSIEKITGKKPLFVKGDILCTGTLAKVFKKHKFDSVIHFAGLKAVGESVAKPLSYYKNNITGTVNLLEAMLVAGVKKIVFSSSATVYGNPAKLPITEDFPLSTTNPYGATKLYIEGILADVARAHPDFTAIILRYFNPVGAHESGLIGENPRGIPNNLSPYIVQVAAGIRSELSVFGNDYKTADGTGVRDYIHVVDLSLGHVAALEKIDEAGCFIYNLGTGKGTSVLELHAAFETAVGKKIPYKFAPRREGDIDACYANCDKALKDLDWKTRLGVSDMCESAWKFYSKKVQG